MLYLTGLLRNNDYLLVMVTQFIKKPFFIYIIFFLIILSISKQLVTLNFDKPVTNNLNKNFNNYILDLKVDFDERMLLRQKNNDICVEVKTGNINRHSLRWVFEKFRLSIFEKSSKIIKNEKLNSYLFSFIISIILFSVFTLLNKIEKKNNSLQKENSIFFIFLIFMFLILLYLTRPLGEIRFSIFEILFVTMSLFFAINKNMPLYLLSIFLCVLNRESGLICGFFWLIFNNLKFQNNNIFKLRLINKFDLKSYLPVFLSLSVLLLFNIDIVKCFLDIEFFVPPDISAQVPFNNNLFKLDIRSLNAVLINLLLIVFIMIIFYKKTIVQNKLVILIGFYLTIFLIFVPIDQYQTRIILVPMLVIYISEFTRIKSNIS